MQLAAYGAQDIYLTGNPQITFFKVVYRRHTNFAIESIQQTLNGSTASSTKQTCTISRAGDLVGRTYLRVKDGTFGMTEGEVYDLVDYVKVEIGGQMIDKQYGDWNAIFWEHHTPEAHVNALRSALMEQSGSVDAANAGCYYPLNFWFCRNAGLYLPLIALQYHETKLEVSWATVPTSATASVWSDYVYLDTDERRRFSTVSHEYLIEQVQRQTFAANTTEFTLNFNHPVKELVWVVAGSANAYEEGCQFTPLGNAGATTNNTAYVPADGDDEVTVKLQLNGNDRFAARDSKYFAYIQPLEHHTRVPAPKRKVLEKKIDVITSTSAVSEFGYQAVWIPDRLVRINNIAFRLHADLVMDSDSATSAEAAEINFKKVRTLVADTADNGTTTLDVSTAGDGSLFEIDASATPATLATTTIYGTGGANVTTSLTNTTFTNSIGSYVDIFGPEDGLYLEIKAASGGTTHDYTGVDMDLIINYEELPTLICGDSSNTANIYTYSFALKPEEHQPSGTCNFSRIDNAKLIFNNSVGSSSAVLKCFARNYNVMRIMSGMAGLAYSN